MKSFFKKQILSSLLISGILFGKTIALTTAGTIIGNSATAIYFDENNNRYTTTSNIVQTTVQEVCGIDLKGGGSYEGIPGQTVYVPFVIKNTGNGENTYNLQLNKVSGTDHIKKIYIDLNQNGMVDPGEQPITNLTLGINESQTLLVSLKINNSESNTDSEQFKLIGSSTAPSGCSANALSTVNVVVDALIKASISVDKSTANLGDTLTYIIDFKNVGTKPAKSKTGINIDGTPKDGIIVIDDIPQGATFKNGSASGQPSGIVVYSVDGTNWKTSPTSPVNYVGFFIPDANSTDGNKEDVLDPDQQGLFEYQVTVNNPFDDPDGVVDNKAKVEYSNTTGTLKSVETNEVHTVIPIQNLADISAGGLDGWAFTSGKWITSNTSPIPEKDSGINYQNDNYVNNAPAGYWVEFKHIVKNNSVKDDLINLEALASSPDTSLPLGSIVEFWNGDGTAKLIDTNADSKVDVGIVQAGSSKNFIVKVFIPANTPKKLLDGTVDYYVTIQAYSKNNPSITDKTRDNIDGILPASIDVGKKGTVGDNKNDPSDGNTDGTNDSDDILPSDNGNNNIKNIINPGEKATFPIEIVNTGVSPDLFNLSVSNIPSNSTVKFFTDPNCDGNKEDGIEVVNTSLLGGTILSQNAAIGDNKIKVNNVSSIKTGDLIIIGAGSANFEMNSVQSVNIKTNEIALTSPLTKVHSSGEKVSEKECYVMVVETSSYTPPVEKNTVVTVSSPTSGATDNIDAYLKIKPVALIIVAPNHSNQLPPGGSTTYQHLVTNNGNVPVDVKITIPSSNLKLSYVILDKDKNVKTFPYIINNLTPGSSEVFYIKVLAPTNVAEGTTEELVITGEGTAASANKSTDTAKDTTLIIKGYLQLIKTVDKTKAKPNEILTYTIQYKNIGSDYIQKVVITDPIPSNTNYVANSMKLDSNCDGTPEQNLTDASGDDTAEYVSSTNSVIFRVGTGANNTTGGKLNPGEQGCVIFKVRIK